MCTSAYLRASAATSLQAVGDSGSTFNIWIRGRDPTFSFGFGADYILQNVTSLTVASGLLGYADFRGVVQTSRITELTIEACHNIRSYIVSVHLLSSPRLTCRKLSRLTFCYFTLSEAVVRELSIYIRTRLEFDAPKLSFLGLKGQSVTGLPDGRLVPLESLADVVTCTHLDDVELGSL